MSSNSNPKDVIPLCEPEISGNEWDYVKQCLDDGWVSSVGSFVTRFEQEFAAYVGASYAIACVNGTSAIHLALLAAGVDENCEVITSDLTFIAPANAIRYTGASPVFIDAEKDHWQMSPVHLRTFLEEHCRFEGGILINRSTSRPVKAILPVHILGHPVDIKEICALAEHYNLTIIEDATESLGASVKGKHCGTFGQSGCFSFNGNKLMTTGSGGMVVTDDEKIAKHIRHLSTQAKTDSLDYIHDEIGYNYRLTNVQAAMGCAQLERLEHFLSRKSEIFDIYHAAFQNRDDLNLLSTSPDVISANWLYTLRIKEGQQRPSSREIIAKLAEQNIHARPVWQPMHLSPAMTGTSYIGEGTSRLIFNEAISLPSSVGLSPGQQARVIDTFVNILEQDKP